MLFKKKSKKSIIESYDGLVKSVEALAEVQVKTLELLNMAIHTMQQLKSSMTAVPEEHNGSMGKVKTGSQK